MDTAQALLRSRRYVYVVFMCHLALEKLLKASVMEYADVFPPYTHNLVRLAEIAGVELPPDAKFFVAKLSEQSVQGRYPEDLKVYTRAVAREGLAETRRVFGWLRQKLTSSA